MNKRLLLSFCFIIFVSLILYVASMDFSTIIHAGGQKLSDGDQSECDVAIISINSPDNKTKASLYPSQYTLTIGVGENSKTIEAPSAPPKYLVK